ncbi:MAG: formate dehydrogenase accessory sulfurtransferase FdhD [Candidatus Tenebribacter burtonii]|jgi:FdhD protein|nr:formate dehydrogenase accessory sulfurtransferase FdhD [Candidatus Tenebribacter burtonii]
MNELKTQQKIKRYKNGNFEIMTDPVVKEVSFRIFVNYKRLVSIACMPENLQELAIGFLFSEGLLLNMKELISSKINNDELYIDFQLQIPEDRITSFFETGEKTSGCGSSLSSAISGERNNFPKIKLKAEDILNQMQQFQQDSLLFKQTGGVHSAGIIQGNKLIFSANDIGRHNAVDKVVGMAVRNNVKLSDSYLICSGRISSEIVKKCIRLDIPLIVSQSAATSEAIRLGWEYKTYIIGFARGKRFNLYTGFDEEIF